LAHLLIDCPCLTTAYPVPHTSVMDKGPRQAVEALELAEKTDTNPKRKRGSVVSSLALRVGMLASLERFCPLALSKEA
jgi:hypothetical protein